MKEPSFAEASRQKWVYGRRFRRQAFGWRS
jgi:hypothetical protein